MIKNMVHRTALALVLAGVYTFISSNCILLGPLRDDPNLLHFITLLRISSDYNLHSYVHINISNFWPRKYCMHTFFQNYINFSRTGKKNQFWKNMQIFLELCNFEKTILQNSKLPLNLEFCTFYQNTRY